MNAGPEVLAGVRDLLPVLRERAQATEDARVVPDASVKALAETGFFRLLQPARFGGLEADPVTFYTAVRLIASACGSTGWVASVLGVHPWQLGLFPLAAQEEVWADDPETRISSSYAPTGRAQAEPTAATGSPGGGASPPAATTPPGCCSAGSWSTTTATRSTSARSCCPPATTRSTTCGTRSGCAAPAATTSWSTTCSCPSTGR